MIKTEREKRKSVREKERGNEGNNNDTNNIIRLDILITRNVQILVYEIITKMADGEQGK